MNHFKEDPRFKVATRESKIIWAFAVIGPAFQIIVAELFGRSETGLDLLEVGGIPIWILLALFIIPFASIAIMAAFIRKNFDKDMPLDGYLSEDALKEYEERVSKK